MRDIITTLCKLLSKQFYDKTYWTYSKHLPVSNVYRTSLNFHCKTIDCVYDYRTEYEHSTKDDTDDNDVGKVSLLSGL